MKHILVTGGCGFVGHHVVQYLLQNTDWNITVNLSLAKMVADAQNKPLDYELVDYHSSRPGHDLRYALDGSLMKHLGWEPKVSIQDRIKQVSDWYLNNPKWMGM